MNNTRIIEELMGKTFTKVENENDQVLRFKGTYSCEFYHDQDCCECVDINDIAGDLSDLENSPILRAEETCNEETDGECGDHTTWTFYRFETAKGLVVVKWKGTSNGYYSESVNFRSMEN